MSEIQVKLTGKEEYVLENLVKRGYFKRKEEAVRADVLDLGKSML